MNPSTSPSAYATATAANAVRIERLLPGPIERIWAYLTEYDLPIHPTYAMNLAGARDRDWLRVSTIGGTRGTGKGRAEWERAYYQDVIDQWT